MTCLFFVSFFVFSICICTRLIPKGVLLWYSFLRASQQITRTSLVFSLDCITEHRNTVSLHSRIANLTQIVSQQSTTSSSNRSPLQHCDGRIEPSERHLYHARDWAPAWAADDPQDIIKMRASPLSLKRTLILSTAVSVALLSTGALAQDTTTTSATDTDTATTSATTDAATTTSDDTTSATATTTATTSSSDDGSTTTSTGEMPTLTTSTSKNADMPTLSTSTNAAGGTVGSAIPTYPAPSVPPTANAPYMQTSHFPENTVFIIVGAIIGGCCVGLVLWRVVNAFLLHRSVERAAMQQHLANDKAAFPAPPAPFYKYSDQDGSSQNVGSGRGVRRSTRGPIPSTTPSQTNLFFSPTAAGGANPRDSIYRDNPNRDSTYRDSSYRDSRFLPAGFYAAGSGSPQNLDGADGSSISLTNLRPDSRGHTRAHSGYGGPESPGFGPQRSPLSVRDVSSSSVNLNVAPDGRAPSAYLEDLLGENPEAFPPSGATPTATNHPNHPYRQSGRF